MALDKKTITEELELLQLEETRERIDEMRRNKTSKAARVAARNRDITENLRIAAAIRASCWHKKGGKGVSQLLQGTDHNYAVIKHTLSHGPLIVICFRCGNVWEPPPVELNARKASVEDKALYKKLWTEYQWAVNLPTDNEPSGTQLFVIPPPEAVAVA
jgi:hypothetical protein